MAKNGDINNKLGIYRTVCCDQEIVITFGATFPDCPKHPKLTTEWKPVIASDGTIINLSESSSKKSKPAA